MYTKYVINVNQTKTVNNFSIYSLALNNLFLTILEMSWLEFVLSGVLVTFESSLWDVKIIILADWGKFTHF